jgi:hypothetical protein
MTSQCLDLYLINLSLSVNQYPGSIDLLPSAAVDLDRNALRQKMLDTIIVASGVMTAVSLIFVSLFMRFGRDWNGR